MHELLKKTHKNYQEFGIAEAAEQKSLHSCTTKSSSLSSNSNEHKEDK
jgi:hypothetical protein